MKHFIGNDISKRDFHAAFDERHEILRFTNDRQGIGEFIEMLKEKGTVPGETVIAMESTGPYHYLAALMLREAKYEVRIINPLITSKQNKATLRRVKNDRKDAQLIRSCALRGEGHSFGETPQTLKLKILVRQRDYLARLKTKLKLRQQYIDHQENCLEKTITSVNQELHDLIQEKMTAIDKELSSYAKELQALLRSIPGVGPQTAITLIAEIGDITRFPSSKELSAFIGLDSRTHESGTSIRGKGYITKRGNKLLRTRLFNAANVAVLRPGHLFYDFFQKKCSEGKPYRVALVAVMHKMVHVIYAVWKRNTPFENRGT